MRLPAVADRLPARISNLARSFHTDEPHGPLRFVVILTTIDDRPLAHGEVIPGRWEFIDGQASFVASGQLTPIDSGQPERGWTFAVDSHGNAALVAACPLEMPKIHLGDTVQFDNTLSVPTSPLPDWLLDVNGRRDG